MMKCMFCGAELSPDARFCGGCGHLIDTTILPNEATGRSGVTSFGDALQEEQQRQKHMVTPDVLPPFMSFAGGNPNVPTIPSVPGMPSFGNVPTVANTPPPVNLPPQPFVQATPPPTPSPFTQFGSSPNVGTPSSFPQHYNQPPANPYYQPSPYDPMPSPSPAPPSAPSSEHEKHLHRKRHHLPKAHHVPAPAAKVVLLVVSVVVVLGAAGAGLAAYFLSRPQPVINISSAYHVSGTPVASTSTVLHITGQKFSGSSAITFLLDGSPVPGNQPVQSDANGNVAADLTVTNAWSLGRHTITARDASNYTTKSGVAVMIVQQGEANTPGPQGAPADDASFKVNISIQGTSQGNNQAFTRQQTIIVTGHPDPTGGTACLGVDDGQPHVYNQTTVDTKEGYSETAVYSCSGSYKAGKITYAQTLTSDVIVFSAGATCTLASPHVDEQVTGSYTGNNTFTGIVTYPAINVNSYTCNVPGSYFFYYGGSGSWTGQVTQS